MEREGTVFVRFSRNCLSRENRLNSTRGSTLPTWEMSTASAMFYRARPSCRDIINSWSIPASYQRNPIWTACFHSRYGIALCKPCHLKSFFCTPFFIHVYIISLPYISYALLSTYLLPSLLTLDSSISITSYEDSRRTLWQQSRHSHVTYLVVMPPKFEGLKHFSIQPFAIAYCVRTF